MEIQGGQNSQKFLCAWVVEARGFVGHASHYWKDEKTNSGKTLFAKFLVCFFGKYLPEKGAVSGRK
jgi:uncharacterized protein YvpB